MKNTEIIDKIGKDKPLSPYNRQILQEALVMAEAREAPVITALEELLKASHKCDCTQCEGRAEIARETLKTYKAQIEG